MHLFGGLNMPMTAASDCTDCGARYPHNNFFLIIIFVFQISGCQTAL